MGFIAWILTGLIAGWLAGQVMKGGGYGTVADIVLGLLGYASIGSAGAQLDGSRNPSLLRKLLVILLWPLAAIGAIDG